MAPRGFEPPTPGLKVQCSDQAELRSHNDSAHGWTLRFFKTVVTRLSYGIVITIK